MIFPVCDPDEMRLTDSDPIIGSWPGEGGQWMLCQRWDYPGLSILMSLTERITSEYSGRGWCWPRPSGSGDTGEVVCKCDHWVSHHQAWRCPWCGECCPPVPGSPSTVSPWCLPQFQDATFTCHQPFLSQWHNVGVIPVHQEARKPIDHWQISELTDLTGTRPSQWVGVMQRLCQSLGCQLSIKTFIFIEKIKNGSINCCISIPSFLGVSINASLPHFYLFWLSIKLLAMVINCVLTHSRGVGWLTSFTIIESTKRTTLYFR